MSSDYLLLVQISAQPDTFYLFRCAEVSNIVANELKLTQDFTNSIVKIKKKTLFV